MAKSKPKSQVEEPKPVVTSLPISTGDTPLVIDLPDGQKLVVGNLESGTVIEVATWRGTGRPDSRTSRLMLGVSSTDELQKDAQKDSSAPQTSKAPNSPVEKVKALISGISARFSKKKSEKKKVKVEKDSPEDSSQFEIDEEEISPKGSSDTALDGINSEIDDLLRSLKSEAFSSAVEVPVRGRTSNSPSKSARPKNSGSGKSKTARSKKKSRR